MTKPAAKKWILLLRGINVGGRNILKMQDLRDIVTALDCRNVFTYIQSGNCTFESEQSSQALTIALQDAIESAHGFRPKALIMTASALKAALKANPYPTDSDALKTVLFFFLSQPAETADMDKLKQLQTATEQFTLTPSVFYLYAPEGIGRSKLAAGAEKALGVDATARNLRTVLKLEDMIAR